VLFVCIHGRDQLNTKILSNLIMNEICRISHLPEVRFLDSRKRVIPIHGDQINSACAPENKNENPHYGKRHPGLYRQPGFS
jgi:hypothetical protein